LIRGPADGDRRVALTFDDGPGEVTPALLDLLAEHSARATFFVLGQSVARREETVRRAVREAHELGNHTWSHAAVWRLSDGEVEGELRRTTELLREVAQVEPTWARPPYGRDWARFARIALELGLRTALWSVDPRDWSEPPAEAIVARVLAELRPGAVVDLHDGWHSRSERTTSQPTFDAVAALLPALAERGYRCVTLSELASGPLASAAP
jgi:peptidoglycan/xylan/chitin deacetylase (PgdA/CDA1 family)